MRTRYIIAFALLVGGSLASSAALAWDHPENGPAPDWADSHHDPLDNPNSNEFARFVQAVGTRYSGTLVVQW